MSERKQRIANKMTDTISVIGDQTIQKTAKDEITNSIDNMDVISEEYVGVRLEAGALTNSTVHALHFAKL